jgi:hypothetical protein
MKFVSDAATTIYVYQTVLGHIDALLATFNYPQTVPEEYTDNTTANSLSNFFAVFDVCLPAGTYSITFVVNAVCSGPTTACSQSSFDFLDFTATEVSDVCSNAAYDRIAGIV